MNHLVTSPCHVLGPFLQRTLPMEVYTFITNMVAHIHSIEERGHRIETDQRKPTFLLLNNSCAPAYSFSVAIQLHQVVQHLPL